MKGYFIKRDIMSAENKYNLTIPKIRKLKVANRSLIGSPRFWRNDVINAWCISGSVGTAADRLHGTDNSFWIGIYDDDAPAYAGRFRFSIETYGGMCSYEFTKFFQEGDIECKNDLIIQKRFLAQITELLDLGIFTL